MKDLLRGFLPRFSPFYLLFLTLVPPLCSASAVVFQESFAASALLQMFGPTLEPSGPAGPSRCRVRSVVGEGGAGFPHPKPSEEFREQM